MAGVRHIAGKLVEALLDFALPPRCPGCLEIVGEVDSFCTGCWGQIEWLRGGCETCGIPLEGTEAVTCGACLAHPPLIDRSRSAVAYGPIARDIALRLKYGRKVALARTMARYMAGLRGEAEGGLLLAPVPLHRWRLWNRGFNQAALVADRLGKAWRAPVEHRLLARTRPTRPLKGMSHSERQRAVAGAFKVPEPERVAGRTVVLVDDVLTSGATSEACARALRKAGASRVELVSWARVVRPARFVR